MGKVRWEGGEDVAESGRFQEFEAAPKRRNGRCFRPQTDAAPSSPAIDIHVDRRISFWTRISFCADSASIGALSGFAKFLTPNWSTQQRRFVGSTCVEPPSADVLLRRRRKWPERLSAAAPCTGPKKASLVSRACANPTLPARRPLSGSRRTRGHSVPRVEAFSAFERGEWLHSAQLAMDRVAVQEPTGRQRGVVDHVDCRPL